MRLIDADALDAAFTDLRFNADGTLAHWGDRPDWCLHGREVEKLIHDAPTVGGWISVEDRMPCENPWESEWVLVWFGEQSALRTEAPLPGKWNPNERTWWVVGFGEKYAELNLKITHWMPLPEPPEEDHDND